LFGFWFRRRFNGELNMADTRELLAEFVKSGSEHAFRELVGRYVNLVYSTARRLVGGNAHLAEDVTQTVFIDLARKARGLSNEVMLGGWLHRRTFNVAMTIVRGERRRVERERRSVEMSAVHDAGDSDIEQIAPILDEALYKLGRADRSAILLRFFEQYDFRAIGVALGSSEDAARMRVTRALGKLHSLLARKGVALSAGALGTILASGAVTAAPVGLAASAAGAALAGSAASIGFQGTFFKLLTMAKLKTSIVCAVVVAGVATPIALQHQTKLKLRAENDVLHQQIAQFNGLAAENERLSNLLAQARNTPTLHLPAPAMATNAPQSDSSAEGLSGTNLIAQILKADKAPQLARQQLEKYLKENRRSVSSLLAAFRATQDQALLREAMEKFPNDPQVAFTAAYRQEGGDRRQWLEVFKKAAPDNALASYLSAGEYFKSGQIDQAVQELAAASGKQQFTDYTMEFGQNDEEAWRAAGYSVAEAKTIGASSLLLPHLAETKQLTQQIASLADAYRQAGDNESAELALRMALSLGQRLDQSSGTPLITQLVGRAIEGIALRRMDPNAPYGTGEQTAQQRLDELARQRAGIKELGQQFDALVPKLSDQDWISYRDRWRVFGEEAALRWLLSKHGGQQ
jgi:RNA polymerase sigma factor (sigma-70 family)